MLYQRWVALFIAIVVFGTQPSFAQSAAESTAPSPKDRRSDDTEVFPVRLIEVYAPRTIVVGEVVNFRVRASNGTPRPFTALWDFDNGYLSVGNPVAHAYTEPGMYTVRVIGRNRTSADTLTVTVTVTTASSNDAAKRTTSAQPVAEPVAEPFAGPAADEGGASTAPAARVRVREASLRGYAAISRSPGTYTWVIASDLWRERLEASVLNYRLQNLRAELYQDPRGRGSPVYRIVVGEFETEEEALTARAWLPPNARKNAYLITF